jgi:transportin-1
VSYPDKLLPELSNIVEYMLFSTKDKNEVIALEACEFWLTFTEDPKLAQYLHPLLPCMAPVLLDCMVYSNDSLLWLEGDEEDDAAVPDKEANIKPHYYGGKSHGFKCEGDASAAADALKKVGTYGKEQLDGDDDNFKDEMEDNDFTNEMSTEWNLYKCST